MITINFTPPTLDITLTNGVTLFDENTEGTEVVFTINNVNNISGLTYSLNNTAQQFLEIDGNEVKRKIGVTFDYETLQDLNVIITATAGSESDSENASIMINDVTEVHDDTILNSPHNVKAFVTFDVADNDPANQNLIEYEVDVNGNSTGRTRAQMTADIAANSWPAGQGVNYIQALAAAEVVIKDGSGNSVLSSSSGADAELFRSAFIDTDGFNQTADQYHIDFHADGLEEIRKIFTAAGFTIPSATSWSIGTAVATPEEKRYTLANYMFADQLARERESGNMESINPDAVRKTANAILSLNDAQISDILDEYAANGYSTTVIGN